MKIIQNNKVIFGIFFSSLTFIYWIYHFGFSGAFYFDDFRPLGKLESVKDLSSAWQYIWNETSGPLGRPISMISFLLNVGDWPNHLDNFFRINTFIHLINGVLIYCISYKLFRLLKPNSYYAASLALFSSFFWMVLPLNISTNLIAVQRMASLSGMFVFAGILSYLYCLDYQQKNYKLGSFLLYGGVAIFTLLAMFSKENGILLPLFLLVLELTILSKFDSILQGRKLRIASLSLCYLTVVLYLANAVWYAEEIYASRPYTFMERISTEPQILVDYLRFLFVPDIYSLNPFHDNYPYNQSFFDTTYSSFSTVFLVALLVFSLICRKKYIVFSFAILWFFTAHLLESTVIGLELYYEHRNYVASFAICFAVVYGMSSIHGRKSQILMSLLFVLYMLGLSICSFVVTKTWGNQYLAAYAWQYNQKGSMRASEHLALKLLEDGNKPDALMYVKDNAKNCPDCLNSFMQQMLIGCSMGLKSDVEYAKNYLLSYNKPIRSAAGLPNTLASLYVSIQEKQCQLVSLDTLKLLNLKFLKSPESGLNIGNHLGLYSNLYQIYSAENQIDDENKYLDKMWALSPQPWIAYIKIESLLKQKKYKDATSFVQAEVCQRAYKSSSPFRQACIEGIAKIKNQLN